MSGSLLLTAALAAALTQTPPVPEVRPTGSAPQVAVRAVTSVVAPVVVRTSLRTTVSVRVAVDASARDTVFEVRRGDRLVVENLLGRISVRAGRGDRIVVEPGPSDEGSISLTRRGDQIVMNDRDSKGRRLDRRLEVTVPEWLDVDLRGRRLDVDVRGLQSSVAVSTLQGDIEVRDIDGSVRVATVSGEVEVRNVRGAVEVSTIEESVVVAGIRGPVRVESTDGDVSLGDIDGPQVDVLTVSGDVDFDGVIQDGGRYALVTHDGDVTASVPENVSARVSVSTFDGSFEAAFPITLQRFRGGREMNFTLGSGSAELRLQAFDGEIVLRHRR